MSTLAKALSNSDLLFIKSVYQLIINIYIGTIVIVGDLLFHNSCVLILLIHCVYSSIIQSGKPRLSIFGIVINRSSSGFKLYTSSRVICLTKSPFPKNTLIIYLFLALKGFSKRLFKIWSVFFTGRLGESEKTL